MTATFAVQFGAGPENPGQGPVNPLTLTATSGASTEVFTVEISSVLVAGTTATQSGSTFNFGQTGSGWNGGGEPDGSQDVTYSGFGPAGAIVLNQRKDGSEAPVDATVDVQEVTFRIFDSNGAPVTVTNVEIDVFDITSVDMTAFPVPFSWRAHYWDAVGFDQTPVSVVSSGGTDPGVGAGTVADPFRRSGGNMYTSPDYQQLDTFAFASFPPGAKMIYTQVDGRQGWHFVSISAMRFTALVGDCVPNPDPTEPE